MKNSLLASLKGGGGGASFKLNIPLWLHACFLDCFGFEIMIGKIEKNGSKLK